MRHRSQARALEVGTGALASAGGGNGCGTTWNGWSDTKLPAAAARGGDTNNGSQGGLFALILRYGASSAHGNVGFRCVVPG